MAEDLMSLLGPADLGGFQQSILANDPYGIMGRSLAQWQPNYSYMNGTESALTSFGKAFASGLLSNYAQNRAADQLSSVVNVLPNLMTDPYSASVPEGVDSSAFNVLRGTAVLNKASRDQALKDQSNSIAQELRKALAVEGVKNGSLDVNQALTAVLTGKLPESGTSFNDPKKNPLSPQGKAARELENVFYNRITALPQYKLMADIDSNIKALPELAKQDTKAADIGLISTIARIRDPNSTVREGEIKINQDTQSYLDSIYGDWRSIVSGKSRLSPVDKLEIISSVVPKYNELKSSYDTIRNPLLQALEDQGGNRANIPTTDFSIFDMNPLARELATMEAKRLKSEGVPSAEIASELRSKFSSFIGGQ